MPDAESDDLSPLLEKQRAYYSKGNTREISSRLASLDALQTALETHQDDILQALATDLAKPAIEAFLAEYYFVLEEIRLVRRSLRKWLRPRRARSPFYFWPCRNEIRQEPFGTVLVIAPWNYPFQLALAPLIAAIAAGNTVILKPSELASATSQLLGDMIAQAFPPEHVSVVTGGPDTSKRLLDQAFDFIFFTGSTEVGREVGRKAADNLTPCVLELGGKCPCVVDHTADLAVAARRILTGKLFNAGQTCFAPDFIAVEENAHAGLVHELKQCLESLPWEKEMAKVVNAHHYQRLQGLLETDAIQKGEDDPQALHFAPRILPDSHWDSPAMSGEIFGPLLPIVTFSSHENLYQHLGKLPTPLALYCFSRDREFAETLLVRISSGSVCLNDTGKQACNLNLPFGGSGASGYGRYRGKASVETFSRTRSITKRYFLPDYFEMLPPRAERGAFLRKWMK